MARGDLGSYDKCQKNVKGLDLEVILCTIRRRMRLIKSTKVLVIISFWLVQLYNNVSFSC